MRYAKVLTFLSKCVIIYMYLKGDYMIVYIAKCIDGDGEPIEITNMNYDALMEGIDTYGYDVLDVVEMDYTDWLASKVDK